MASALPADVDKAQDDSIDFNDVLSLRKPKDAKAGAWGVLENGTHLQKELDTGWVVHIHTRALQCNVYTNLHKISIHPHPNIKHQACPAA